MPEWAYFLMRLGSQLVDFPRSNNHRLVIGLAIPVRAFASSMVALGVTLERANNPTLNNSIQLERILKLEPGTSIFIRTKDKKIKGVLEGFQEQLGKTYIIVKTGGLQKNRYPLDLYASRITTSSKDVNLPEKHQKGYSLEPPSKFLQCCVGQEKAVDYILDSSLDVLIIGRVGMIRDEMCSHPFICRASHDSQITQGCLHEVLRTRQFCGANNSYRTQCLPGLGTMPSAKSTIREPFCVVFDGATAYIRNQHMWNKSHLVVLLDRTDRQFSDAVSLLNQNSAYRTTENTKFPIRIPSEIEMMIYEE